MSDRWEKLRLPEVSRQFPHETICYFSDYHEAVGWILANDRPDFLANLGETTLRRPDAHAIDGV